MTTKNISKLRITLIGLAVLVAIGILAPATMKRLLPSSSAAAVPPTPASVPATTVKVAQESVPIYLSGIGTAQALATVTIRTRVDGQLDKINFV